MAYLEKSSQDGNAGRIGVLYCSNESLISALKAAKEKGNIKKGENVHLFATGVGSSSPDFRKAVLDTLEIPYSSVSNISSSHNRNLSALFPHLLPI